MGSHAISEPIHKHLGLLLWPVRGLWEFPPLQMKVEYGQAFVKYYGNT